MKTKISEKIFETMLDEAAAQYADDMGKKLDYSPTDFSAKHQRKMNKMFNREHRKENMISFSHIAKRVACILLIAAVCSLAAVGSVEAWRNKVLQYVFDPDAPGTFFDFGKSDNESYYFDWGINMKYIPSGFKLQADNSARNIEISFVNDKNEYFNINSQPLKGTLSVDTEDGTVEEFIINGNKAISIQNKNGNSVLWYDDNYSYILYGNIPQNELLKIVKNIEISKN